MTLSFEQFKVGIGAIVPAEEWYPLFVEYMEEYDINTVDRIAGFLSQVGHESMGMKYVSENLNYSWTGLIKVFGRRYFPSDSFAKQFHRNPMAIANHVYDDRNPARSNKLGNIYDGDGWKFRGGGLIQLTGRETITAFGNSIGMSPEETAEYIRTKRGAVHSACWYWKTRNLNYYADRRDVVGMTKVINGGKNGLDDRQKRYTRAKNILGADSQTSTIVLKQGSRDKYTVRKVQSKLGIPSDGIFGPQTAAAIKSWQRINKLSPTGYLTQSEITKMFT